ncbi:hypothetical protein AMELA_G00092630 [Ameiurus melas]|uniref:Uncharacterized protein n=1 Tax=Ameiurus melas TaxID=219545 RepID=A0A7J6AYF5_AMEME|nr:hypothetical protein AMELA_G00092630 [Ameiurus melas]
MELVYGMKKKIEMGTHSVPTVTSDSLSELPLDFSLPISVLPQLLPTGIKVLQCTSSLAKINRSLMRVMKPPSFSSNQPHNL